MASQQSMPVTIPATKAHREFGALIRRVFSGKEHFIIEKDGLPVVVIIAMSEYQELMKERERREERVKRFRQTARAIGGEAQRQGLTEEQLMAEMEEDKQSVYRETYGDEAG